MNVEEAHARLKLAQGAIQRELSSLQQDLAGQAIDVRVEWVEVASLDGSWRKRTPTVRLSATLETP